MPRLPQPQTFEQRIERILRLRYLLFLPRDYDANAKKRWPLILFLHGAGERGTDTRKLYKHGPPKLVREGHEFPFIIVAPQCPRGLTWLDEALLALLDDVIQRQRVDRRRIYLTGLSMGGYGTWSLGLNHPERFAAIAPICGGGDLISLLLTEGTRLKQLRRLPVWAFHGAKDDVVKLAESERMIHALRELENDAKLTVYPDSAHNSWAETYQNPALYEWFLQQRSPGK